MSQQTIKERLELWERPKPSLAKIKARLAKAAQKRREHLDIIGSSKKKKGDGRKPPQADELRSNLETRLCNARVKKDILLTQVASSAVEANKKKQARVELLNQGREQSRKKQLEMLENKIKEAQDRQEFTLLSRKEKAMESNALIEERVQEVQRERSFKLSELACRIQNKLLASSIRQREKEEKGSIDEKLEKAKAFKLSQRSSLASQKEKLEDRLQQSSERRDITLQSRAANACNDSKIKNVSKRRKEEETRLLQLQSKKRERLEEVAWNRRKHLKGSFVGRTKKSSPMKVKDVKQDETLFSLTMLFGWIVVKIKQLFFGSQ
jgi:hypothetical protein